MPPRTRRPLLDTMVSRTLDAADRYAVNGILLGGGVAANTLLRLQDER